MASRNVVLPRITSNVVVAAMLAALGPTFTLLDLEYATVRKATAPLDALLGLFIQRLAVIARGAGYALCCKTKMNCRDLSRVALRKLEGQRIGDGDLVGEEPNDRRKDVEPCFDIGQHIKELEHGFQLDIPALEVEAERWQLEVGTLVNLLHPWPIIFCYVCALVLQCLGLC